MFRAKVWTSISPNTSIPTLVTSAYFYNFSDWMGLNFFKVCLYLWEDFVEISRKSPNCPLKKELVVELIEIKYKVLLLWWQVSSASCWSKSLNRWYFFWERKRWSILECLTTFVISLSSLLLKSILVLAIILCFWTLVCKFRTIFPNEQGDIQTRLRNPQHHRRI